MSVIEKLEQLKEAEASYEQAKSVASVARSRETDALNRLNEAQRAFDAEVASIKDDSPGVDWKAQRRHASRPPAGREVVDGAQ